MRKIGVTVKTNNQRHLAACGSLARRTSEWGRRVPSSSGTLVGSFRGWNFTRNKSKSEVFFALGCWEGRGEWARWIRTCCKCRSKSSFSSKSKTWAIAGCTLGFSMDLCCSEHTGIICYSPPSTPLPASVSKRLVWGRELLLHPSIWGEAASSGSFGALI